jgi:hypothetical protein
MIHLRVFFVDAAIVVLAFSLSLTACGRGSTSSGSSSSPSSYSLSATALSPASITAGNTSTSTITLTPTSGYTGTVTLSCAALTSSNPPACSFSPNPVTINGSAAGSKLTVSTSVNTPGGNYNISITGKDTKNLAPSNGSQSLTLTAVAVIEHVVVIFQENRTPDNLFQDPVLIGRGADIVQQGKEFIGPDGYPRTDRLRNDWLESAELRSQPCPFCVCVDV